MTIIEARKHQVFDSAGNVIEEVVEQVDVTVQVNRSAVEQAVDAAHDALAQSRTELDAAIANVQAKVPAVQAVANSTGTLTGAQLSNSVRAIAGAQLAHMQADRELMDIVKQVALNQRQMMKLLLLLAKPEAADRLLQVPD